MTAGIVLTYCDVNESPYNYASLSTAAANQASELLKLPHTVTTTKATGNERNRVYEGGRAGAFFNTRMVEGLRQTPYDITLFMDSDFVVQTDSLRLELEAFKSSKDPIRFLLTRSVDHVNNLPPYNPSPLWSTLLLYRNTSSVNEFFNTVNLYADNWIWTLASNNLPSRMVFRNDVAWGLSAKIVFGEFANLSFTDHYRCTFSRFPYNPDTKIADVAGTSVRVPFDTHAMDKEHLLATWSRLAYVRDTGKQPATTATKDSNS